MTRHTDSTYHRIHIINIVIFPSGAKYHSDIAFGGDGPLMPMPLDAALIHQNLGTQQVRFVRDWMSTQTYRVEESKVWIYQYRNGEAMEWNSYYAFPEVEFMEADWEVVNWWTSTNPKSRHPNEVLVVKFLGRNCGEEGWEEREIRPRVEVWGKRMLVGRTVKENPGAKTRTIAEYWTEEERVRGLREHFGIILTEEEAAAIDGRVTELR